MIKRLVACLLLTVSSSARAQLSNIGAAAAVRGEVKATAPVKGAAGRILKGGQILYQNDRIKTQIEARLQILLLDETVFTVGPHTELILDEYVYDPKKGVGKVSASITQGVFRFVSGKVAKKNAGNMKVTLPVGTIGIRGTDVAGIVRPNGESTIMLKQGAIVFSNALGTVILDTPGDTITVAPGKAPSKPFPASKALLTELNGLIGPPLPQAMPGVRIPAREPGSTTGAPGESAPARPGPAASVDLMAAQANQDIFTSRSAASAASVDGTSTWGQVQSIASPANATYTGAGTVNCTGINCGGGGGSNPAANLTLEVNFAARTYGGGASLLQIAAPLAFFGDSTPISNTSYNAEPAAANAVITLSDGVNAVGAQWNGTTLTFANNGGTLAKQVQVNVTYNNGSDVVNSTNLTGSRP